VPTPAQWLETRIIRDVPLDDLPIALLFVTRNHIIAGANKFSHTLFGYEPSELYYKPIDLLVPIDYRVTHHKLAEEYWGKPPLCPKRPGDGRLLHGLKKDGTVFPVEISLLPYKEYVMALVIAMSNFKK
jgi:PAS domain S-box-containing protein